MDFDHYVSVQGCRSQHYRCPSTTLRVGRVTFSTDIEVAICDVESYLFQARTMPEIAFKSWTEKPWSLRPTTCRAADAYYDVPSQRHGSVEHEDAHHDPGDQPDELEEEDNQDQRDGNDDDHDPEPPVPSDGGFSSDEDPQALHIYRLGRPHVFGHVDWNTYRTVLRDAAQLVRMHINVLTGFHYMRASLDGLQDAEEAIILQHINDIAVGSEEKLVIVDVAMHTRANPGQVPPAPTITRTVHKVLPQLARQHILTIAGVDSYCDWVQHQCIVYLNHQVWEHRDNSLKHILHGMYIKVTIPPPPSPHWNTVAAVRVAQDVGSIFGFPAAHELASQILEHEYETDPPHATAVQPWQARPHDQEDDIDVPMTFPPGARMPRLRPRHDGNMQWLDQLAVIFRDEAVHEVLDGPPLLYIQTWYVHHARYARCEAPRPIRLDNAMITWLEEFRFAWRDRWDRRLPFSVHIVLPRPPQPRYQGYACHVLFEQAQPPHRVAGVITNLFEGAAHDALQQFAATMPRIVRSADVIDELGLNIFCDVRRCTTTVGGQPLHLILAHDLTSGFNMCTRIAPPRSSQQLPVLPGDEDAEHFADISFLQHHVRLGFDTPLQPVQNSPVSPKQTALNLPHAPQEGQPFGLRANAPVFIPGAFPIDADDFTQDLYHMWCGMAWQWEDETPSIEILVWFADHSSPMPHGLYPRRVRLWPDYTRWEEEIKRTWQDLLQAGAPTEFHIVEPAPPRLEPGIMCHVILLQHAREDWVTSLVTLFDEVGTYGPDHFFRRAVTTFEHIYLEHLLTTMGYADSCLLRPSQFLCQAWYHDQVLQMGRPLQGRSGYGIEARVQRTPVWRGSITSSHDTNERKLLLCSHIDDGSTLHQLQQFASVIDQFTQKLKYIHIPGFDLHGPEHPVETPGESNQPSIQLDMREIQARLQDFDQLLTLPCYNLERWQDVTPWLDLWWDCQSTITDVWIYHDGSHRPDGSGAAAVAFLSQPSRGWVFGGAVSISLQAAITSYGAELRGGLLAIQFGIDILKITTLIQKEPPQVCLLHDNTAVGNQLFWALELLRKLPPCWSCTTPSCLCRAPIWRKVDHTLHCSSQG